MEKISETRILNLISVMCKQYAMSVTYDEGSKVNGRCWRVTFRCGPNASRELIGVTRREIYDALHAFWNGMAFEAACNLTFRGL